ncbi:MAG TPA: phage tail tape measure protein [Pseudomonas sp.]|jgi:TP901 family phage tail tape measure protein|nr:phage tail tape measure protein [Phycisphaerae bacterium]MBU0810704.1 phage tail tape measure protein [Gammaproteobacteria bacterium]HAQ87437.1 phage tail tape measure protein [Pseudomonas sp.]MBU0853340.1 phage tail tape measure protein [Gammaproteobacteria bacterium]MBU1300077.1 phage tail tape measure protein [Gammaproteobacteria bacterium]|tara:strand:- start:2490 stop:4364 length:1875 start_codon:yes stop_codon:yes gene_type:complete
MASNDLELALRLTADVSRLQGGLSKGEAGLRKFGSAAKGELAALGRFAGSVEGKLAQLGLGVSAIAVGMQSAQLDKDLKQLQLTAGATAREADLLRQSWFEAQIATGQGVDELRAGSDALIAAGLSIQDARAAVLPMAATLAVAEASATDLANAMGVAAKQFDIDLSSQHEAALLLDRFVVAGRLGSAELNNLSSIFPKIGASAKAAGLDLSQSLALTETLSAFEPNADRLGTLTESTLRVFTNDNYRKAAEKAAGVKFFNADQSQRDPFKVIEDIKSKYDKLTTDLQKNNFLAAAFGTADQDTIKGVRNLLSDGAMTELAAKFKGVEEASGTIARDLPDAISNAVDQTNRLKGALREAADDFAKPVNDTLSGLIKWGMDSKKNGGLGLDGKDMLIGGALGAAGLFGAGRYGGKAISGLAGKLGGTAAGVATGKALEEAAGVPSVYVVNMPSSFGPGSTAERLTDVVSDRVPGGKFKGAGKWLGRAGIPLMLAASGLDAYNIATDDRLSSQEKTVGYSGAAGGAAGGLAGAAAGAALGSVVPVLGTAIGGLIGGALGYWGGGSLGEMIAEAVTSSPTKGPSQPADVSGKIEIHISSEGKPKVTRMETKSDIELGVYTGHMTAGR